MKNKTCGECKHYGETHCKARAIEVLNDDIACDRIVLKNETLFDRITESPEVLAPYLVFFSARDNGWCSMLTAGSYDTYKEAIAATVAKLKEVCDEN